MRKHILFMTLAFAGILMMSCSPKQATENADVTELPESEIMVYYFHNERRCATCEAVEAETKAALEKYYPEELKDGKIAFVSLNLEETTGAEIAGRFQIASQALIIVKGEDLKDITSEGFLYARTAPDKLYDAVKSSVDSML
ncbi:MAG TPA: nitrophenyl compound nitroreductase subunit ArsF family protein [Lentimicrobium sp.]|nr:nitrophenyl compound nitroreductase subunit ArsF family protein [Lentimicrobium sp.]